MTFQHIKLRGHLNELHCYIMLQQMDQAINIELTYFVVTKYHNVSSLGESYQLRELNEKQNQCMMLCVSLCFLSLKT